MRHERWDSERHEPQAETLRFKAEDVPVIDNGSLMHSGEEGPLLFALNGLLLPDGQARGTCIGSQTALSGRGQIASQPGGTGLVIGGSGRQSGRNEKTSTP